MNGKIPTNPVPVRIARIYFKEPRNPDEISKLLKEPGYEYGGWRKDERGKYLRLIAIGDATDEELTTKTFSKYGNIEKIAFEEPWPQIPGKITVIPLSAKV
jgi:hypothetical protein